ncbi:hypothetical protein T492DRAFT_1046150 [Pavlovales sp. CCMP2436]|nr:hypothetical protein T492DRAFT_1046150 [Pavlovales sp. CCMP2436]|mmetsp:Transcript_13324/g.31380  ORF Transcript_13324/g.31380 Transcript_13324/m.31380 type:complete len:275 (-) Transcript_13324:19-843(-)
MTPASPAPAFAFGSAAATPTAAMPSGAFQFGAAPSYANPFGTPTAAASPASPFQSPLARGGLRWDGLVATAQRSAQQAVSALLQHQRRWDAYTTESARTLERLANARTQHEYLTQHPPDALGAHAALSAKLAESSARECARLLSNLEEDLARLSDANEGMQGAARTARATIDTAVALLGEEWAQSDALLRSVSADRLCALADTLAAEHARELELKAAIVADLRSAGLASAAQRAAERSELRTLYLASWIMQPGRSRLGDESSEHCVRALSAECQ